MCFSLIGRLGKPKITQSLMTSVNSTCNVTLTCSVEKEEMNVIYSWSPRGEKGSVLQILQTPENQELTYTCTAQNPISNNSDSISAQQLCSGNQLLSTSPRVLQTTLKICKAWIWASSFRAICLPYGRPGPHGLLPESPGNKSKAFWDTPGISVCSEVAPAWFPHSISNPGF